MKLSDVYTTEEQITLNKYFPTLDFNKDLTEGEIDEFDDRLLDLSMEYFENDEPTEPALFLESMMDRLREYEDAM